jgi:LmbE family N-acetylglucosaminyl deacetylase
MRPHVCGSVERILVLSPHADDEVIGCGGLIARAADAGARVDVVIMAAGGVLHRHRLSEASLDERLAELEACGHILGIAHTRVIFPGKDMQLETVPMFEIVSALDRLLNEGRYDEIYIPEPTYNADHRVTHEAALASLRPGGPGGRPALIAAYESVASRTTGPNETGGALYVDISAVIDRKLEGLRQYRSQLRPFPHPTSIEVVRSLAVFRGAQCGTSYAEMFRVLQMIR